MTVTAKIIGYNGKNMIVVPDVLVDRELIQKQINRVEIRLNDGRTITADQRRKAYATLRDIADYSGHEPEYLKEWFKYEYMIKTGGEYFSLSDCSVTVAREYINVLVDFCLRHGVPLYEPMTERTDDIGAYLYMCLYYRKCAVCGRAADVHHVTGSKLGMGADREKAHHLGREAIALCRKHHNIAHTNENDFFKENHIYGIKLDETLCERLNLRK